MATHLRLEADHPTQSRNWDHASLVSEGDSSGASSEGRKLSHFQVSIVSMALAPSLSVAISCPTVKFLMVVGMIVHFHDVGNSCVVPSALNPKP
jgi:hypothetical protein